MNESMPDAPVTPRRVGWGYWFAGIVLFPWGVFLVLGMARLLSWTRSVLLAMTSLATGMIFVEIMADLDNSHASELSHALALAGGTMMYCGWGYLMYEIGQKVEYWSPRVLRGWRWAAWLAIFVLSLNAVTIAMAILISGGGPS